MVMCKIIPFLYFPEGKVSISVLESESFLVMHDDLVKILTKALGEYIVHASSSFRLVKGMIRCCIYLSFLSKPV